MSELINLLKLDGYGYPNDQYGIRNAIRPRINFKHVHPYDIVASILELINSGELERATFYNKSASVEMQIQTTDRQYNYGDSLCLRNSYEIKKYLDGIQSERDIVIGFRIHQGIAVYHPDWELVSQRTDLMEGGEIETYLILSKESGLNGGIKIKGTSMTKLFPMVEEMPELEDN
ncbi:MAG: hypothetical protein V1870_01680 [Candidatus Aenigmatarchaeota archaeon]